METNAYFKDLKALHYRIGIKMLEHCYNKYLTLDGDDVEGLSYIFIKKILLLLSL